MTFIDSESAVRGEIIRKVASYDSNADSLGITEQQIVGAHWVDLQPYAVNENIANEQFQLHGMFEVYPESNILTNVRANDFYRVAARDYRIVEPSDYRTVGYFRVLDENIGVVQVSGNLLKTIVVLGPGVYTYGSGALAGIGIFAIRPILIDTLLNDGSHFIQSPTINGFEIVDRGAGAPPVVSCYIEGTLA